jgi:hypothetical protein
MRSIIVNYVKTLYMKSCIDSKIKVPGLFFSLFDVDGKRYIVPNWIEVPMNTTFDDIELIKPAVHKPPNQITGSPDVEVIVKSSTGKGEYIVKRLNDRWTCNCPASMYRRMECKHIKQTKDDIYKHE